MNPEIAPLREALEATPNLIFAYIYGSRAVEGRSRPSSDIDLAIYCETALSAPERLSLWNNLNQYTAYPIDLVDLHTTTTVLAHQIITSGKLLLTKNKTISQTFVLHAYADYWDFNISRREVLAQRLPAELLPPDLPYAS